MEIQKNNGQIATIVNSYESQNEAESKYHQILSVAALSQVEKHSATLLYEDGRCYMSMSYEHSVENDEVEE
ncbi:MAG: hypothetical protein IKO36_01570 [Bacteroidaceae bacterium]|nr:hypothetical protein [Bacteroidaceae bacterium]